MGCVLAARAVRAGWGRRVDAKAGSSPKCFDGIALRRVLGRRRAGGRAGGFPGVPTERRGCAGPILRAGADHGLPKAGSISRSGASHGAADRGCRGASLRDCDRRPGWRPVWSAPPLVWVRRRGLSPDAPSSARSFHTAPGWVSSRSSGCESRSNRHEPFGARWAPRGRRGRNVDPRA